MTSGSLTIRADFVGWDTTVGRIISRVEEAQSDRAPIQTVATHFTQRFVSVSFALAAVTYVVTRDARRAMTMLLIACPSAAGLATDRHQRGHRQRRPPRHPHQGRHPPGGHRPGRRGRLRQDRHPHLRPPLVTSVVTLSERSPPTRC